MSRKRVCVIIPVYKSQPTDNEVKSLEQCFKVLVKHPVSLICPNSLNVSLYESIASGFKKQIGIDRFNDGSFVSIQSYNRLLLSSEFYKRFKDFEYILVYQLDAWVFRDDLDYWCRKKYDYIGAPWFENYGSHEDGNALWAIGNGGFSLRNVKSFLKVLNYRGPVKKPSVFLKELNIKSPGNIIKKLALFFLMCFGYRNNIRYFLNRFNQNEDFFWEQFLKGGFITLKMPSPEIAAHFSFEKSPEYLFSMIGEKLPFGCHAWEKNLNFWNQYIIEKS